VTAVICIAVSDSGIRRLSLLSSTTPPADDQPIVEPDLAEVVTLQRRKAAGTSGGDEEALYLDTLAEYQWARDVSGLAATTLDRLVRPVVEICERYGVVAWRLTRLRWPLCEKTVVTR
jgi:integrase/recombinase XerC